MDKPPIPNSCADFDDHAAFVRWWLESLPILPPDALPLAGLPAENARQLRLDAALDLIAARWLAYPSASAEGSTAATYRGEPDLLELSFDFYLWAISEQRLKITVARVADDAYRVWLSKDGTFFAPDAG